MNTPFLQAVFTIVRKDLLTEFRTRELISAMLIFSLLSILVFSFALELNRKAEKETISGVLWVTIIFASILGLNRSLVTEREQNNLDAMLLAPINRTTIYFGKMVGNFIFTFLVGLLLLFVMTIIFTIDLINLLLVATLILGVLGITSIGTLIAMMTVQTRTGETLLPIAIMPVILPVVLTVIRLSNSIMENTPHPEWLATITAIDIIYIVISYLLFEYVLED